MANRFANGAKAFGFCDLCGFRFDLKKLKNLTVKTKQTQIKACPQCWTPDQPQLQLGKVPMDDPQALKNARPDQSLIESRDIQWGWNPVGGGEAYDDSLTPNYLVAAGAVGTVTVST